MNAIARDTWRAVLVVVVAVVLRELFSEPPQPTTAQPPQPVVYYQPQPPVGGNLYQPPEQRNDKPLRRIGSAFLELGDSVIGAIRR